jgi:hypothetical protein
VGAIGRWIDARCAAEPEVMRQVLTRRFGDLSCFLDWEDGRRCGCMVGTYGLIRRDRWVREYVHPAMDSEDFQVGVRVEELTVLNHARGRKRHDAEVIRLLKQRIRKALGLSVARRNETLALTEAV